MMIKRLCAAVMLLVTCSWAAWLFGSVDWAGAQKERVDMSYTPDPQLASTAAGLDSREKMLRNYLQEVDRVSKAESGTTTSYETTRRTTRDVFGGVGRAGRIQSPENDGLEIIYVDVPKVEVKAKATFPVERYKLTGVMLGPDSRAFILDTVENISCALRVGEKVGDGTISTIGPAEISVTGKFGSVTLKK